MMKSLKRQMVEQRSALGLSRTVFDDFLPLTRTIVSSLYSDYLCLNHIKQLEWDNGK